MRNLHIIRGTLFLAIISLFFYNVKLVNDASKPLIFSHSAEYNTNLSKKYEAFDSNTYSEIYLRDGSKIRFKGRVILSHSKTADYVFFRSGKAFLNGKRLSPWSELYFSEKGFDKDHVSKGNYYHLVDKLELTWGKYIAKKPVVVIKEKKVEVVKEVVKKVEVIKEIEVVKEVEKKEESFIPWEEILVGAHILFFLL